MEKRKPHYRLSEIQAHMKTVATMNLTNNAKVGIRLAGMIEKEALQVVHALRANNFYKSMTIHRDHHVWQDVYCAEWKDKKLYIKFQRQEEYFVISFKEL